MARTNDPNCAGSQFFIMHADRAAPRQPVHRLRQGDQGLEVVDKIVNAPETANDRPNNPTTIKKITIAEK